MSGTTISFIYCVLQHLFYRTPMGDSGITPLLRLIERSKYYWKALVRSLGMMKDNFFIIMKLILSTVESIQPYYSDVLLQISQFTLVFNFSSTISHKNCGTNPLPFRPARCTRQPSEQFKTIFTFSQHWMGGMGGCKHIF